MSQMILYSVKKQFAHGTNSGLPGKDARGSSELIMKNKDFFNNDRQNE